jgi:hypothetical protein
MAKDLDMSDAARIDSAAIIRQAEILAGTANADEALAARVRSLIDWVNGLGALTSADAAAGSAQIRTLLFNRLRLASDRTRITGIAAERIEKPIFVVGMARTGTSLLHSLLALDPGTEAPVWWHTVAPSPPPGEVPVTLTRRHLAAQELDNILLRAPGLLALHPYWDKRDQAIVEDEEIFALDFRGAYPTKLFDIPTLQIDIRPADPPGAYAFLRTFLQHLQWNRSVKRWVCKGVMHQFYLASLLQEFPDAVCIWPHRDPSEIMPSVLAIITTLFGAISHWRIDPREIAASQVEGYKIALNSIADDPTAKDPRVHHVNFRQLSADPIGTIRNFYAASGLAFSDAFEKSMRAWLDDPANSSNRYGRTQYSLEPYGLDPTHVKDAFAPYRRHFGLS